MADTGNIFATVIGIDRIQKKLTELPPALGNVGTEAATNYLLNVLVNKEIPPNRSVFEGSRTMAYGKPFFSPAQRNYFFAVILPTLPYVRGGKGSGMQSQWFISGSGMKMSIHNETEASFWVYDNQRQARQLALVGWKKIGAIIEEYSSQIFRSFQTAVKTYINKYWGGMSP